MTQFGNARTSVHGCTGRPDGAYREGMGRTVLTVLGVLFAIWLAVTVLGMIITTVKFLIYVGFVVLVIMAVVAVVGRLAKGR
jgi:hypothetical protein